MNRLRQQRRIKTVPVQPCELTLPNGVYLGMDYETAVKTAQSFTGTAASGAAGCQAIISPLTA